MSSEQPARQPVNLIPVDHDPFTEIPGDILDPRNTRTPVQSYTKDLIEMQRELRDMDLPGRKDFEENPTTVPNYNSAGTNMVADNRPVNLIPVDHNPFL